MNFAVASTPFSISLSKTGSKSSTTWASPLTFPTTPGFITTKAKEKAPPPISSPVSNWPEAMFYIPFPTTTGYLPMH